MNAASPFKGIIGNWTGTYRLWLTPAAPARESTTAAAVTLAAGGRVLALAYDWANNGKPHDGLLIVQCDDRQETTTARCGSIRFT